MICLAVLNWPASQPRTPKTQTSKFRDHSVASILLDLEAELGRWGVLSSSITITGEMPVGKSGRFISGWRIGDDHGVAVYWKKGDQPFVMAIDRYDRPEDNLHAVVKSIEALRSLERWGGNGIANQAMQGFMELPGQVSGDGIQAHWSTVLGVPPDAPLEQVQAAYRELAAKAHPDRGGDHESMADINAAMDQFKAEREARI